MFSPQIHLQGCPPHRIFGMTMSFGVIPSLPFKALREPPCGEAREEHTRMQKQAPPQPFFFLSTIPPPSSKCVSCESPGRRASAGKRRLGIRFLFYVGTGTFTHIHLSSYSVNLMRGNAAMGVFVDMAWATNMHLHAFSPAVAAGQQQAPWALATRPSWAWAATSFARSNSTLRPPVPLASPLHRGGHGRPLVRHQRGTWPRT